MWLMPPQSPPNHAGDPLARRTSPRRRVWRQRPRLSLRRLPDPAGDHQGRRTKPKLQRQPPSQHSVLLPLYPYPLKVKWMPDTPEPSDEQRAPRDAKLSSFIWSVANLLRGDFRQSDYGKVILPFTVLRRLDCVLDPTKAAVLAELATRSKAVSVRWLGSPQLGSPSAPFRLAPAPAIVVAPLWAA